MQLWLDTIDEVTIARAEKLGILFGVTTNPSILSRTKEPPEVVVFKLLHLQKGPVAVQVTQDDYENIVLQAKHLHKLNDRIIVKIPANEQGLKAMNELRKCNIPTMATTIVEVKQFFLASLVSPQYIALYLSAMITINNNYELQLSKMKHILQSQQGHAKILAASIKTVDQLLCCAEIGIHAVTITDQIFKHLIDVHPLVDDYLERFKLSGISA